MKKILITGGNKGIGLATTMLFLKNGYEVIIVARDTKDVKIKNKNLRLVSFDLTHIEEIPQLVHKIGPIDVLINNAGLMNSLPYNNYPKEKKETILKINIEAPVALITEFSKEMVKKGRGRIVSVASIAGEIGHPDVWYGITKAGVINYTKSFALLLGPKGIIVNCVAPGPVEGTALFEVIPDSRKAQLKQATVSDRFAKPDEIAQTIYWLAIDSPEYINGVCIDVNNGAFLR